MSDWADNDAATHLRYLDRCHSDAEQREYLAAALRVAESNGACRASKEAAAALGITLAPVGRANGEQER